MSKNVTKKGLTKKKKKKMQEIKLRMSSLQPRWSWQLPLESDQPSIGLEWVRDNKEKS